MGNNKFYMKVEGETREEILESIEKVKKAMENAIIGEEKEIEEDDEVECNGDCENCENYVEENDPEVIYNDLNQAIACLLYYDIEIPAQLVLKYNKARRELNVKEYYQNANRKDS